MYDSLTLCSYFQVLFKIYLYKKFYFFYFFMLCLLIPISELLFLLVFTLVSLKKFFKCVLVSDCELTFLGWQPVQIIWGLCWRRFFSTGFAFPLPSVWDHYPQDSFELNSWPEVFSDTSAIWIPLKTQLMVLVVRGDILTLPLAPSLGAGSFLNSSLRGNRHVYHLPSQDTCSLLRLQHGFPDWHVLGFVPVPHFLSPITFMATLHGMRGFSSWLGDQTQISCIGNMEF